MSAPRGGRLSCPLSAERYVTRARCGSGPNEQTGTLDFSLPTSTALARIDPKLLILSLPYLFRSVPSAHAVLDKRAIVVPSDLAGLRIRVPQSGVSVALFRALGANPVALPYTRVYAALRSGAIDGQENPFVNIWTGKFYEMQRRLAITHHQFEALGLAVSERTWSRFDAPTRAAVAEAAHEAAAFHRARFDRLDAALRGRLAARGTQITVPDPEPFRAKSRPLHRELATIFSADLVREVERAAHR